MSNQSAARETITIVRSTHPDFGFPGNLLSFIRLASIPEKYRVFFLRHVNGSCCPAPDDKRDTFWEVDVKRILRVIGVEIVFVDQAPAS